MIDVAWLKSLISVLKESGVTSFKTADLQLTLGNRDVGSGQLPAPTSSLEGQIPVDLRIDPITDFDKIRDWSASPGPEDEKPLPGTNDTPLAGV